MIETKRIRLSEKNDKYIDDLTAFQWQLTEVVNERHARVLVDYQIMARDNSIEHYDEYRRLENDYEIARSKLKIYNPMDFLIVLLLLLIFIIPGVIYITYKSNQKSTIEDNNQECKSQMQKAIDEAREI